MSGLKAGFAALVLVGWFGSSARAQGVVPGGWAAQFGYQSFGGPGFVGGTMFGVEGVPIYGGATSTGFGGLTEFGPGILSSGPGAAIAGQGFGRPTYPGQLSDGLTPMPQTVNGIDPLIHGIRQSTRRARRP